MLQKRLQLEAGPMPNKTEGERLVLLQNALGYAAMEIVASDPVEGLEQALELLDMADDGLGPGGKALFPPGTKHAGTLDNLRSEARSVARQQEYASRNDAPELINGLTAQFVLDNPEATKDEIEAFQNGPFADALRADGQTELEVSAAKLDFMKFATANVSDLDPDVLLDAQLRSHVNEITVPEILALALSKDITYESASRLISTVEGKQKASDLGSGVNRGATSAIANNAGKILLGFPDDLLVEEKDQLELRKISTEFRAAFAAALDVAGDDPTKVAEVLKNFEEGGTEALRFSKKLDRLKPKRSDMQLDAIYNSNKVAKETEAIRGVFRGNLPSSIDGPTTLRLDRELDKQLKASANAIRLEKIKQGDATPGDIVDAVESDLIDNSEAHLKKIQTLVDASAEQAAKKITREFAAADVVRKKASFGAVDVTESNMIPGLGRFLPGGAEWGRLDLGDIWEKSSELRANPTAKPAQEMDEDHGIFTTNTIELLTQFISGKVATKEDALLATGHRLISTPSGHYTGMQGGSTPKQWKAVRGVAPVVTEVSPESLTIDRTVLDKADASILLNNLLGLRGIPAGDLLQPENPIDIGVKGNIAHIPIWFGEGQHAAMDKEIAEMTTEEFPVPSEDKLRATKWGQMVENLGLPQIHKDEETGAVTIMAVYLSKQQHVRHHTTKGKQ
jgi:hypothetical protein